MGPGDIYVVAVVLTAIAVSPFNPLARVVVLAWLVAHLLWMTGVPEPFANLIGHAAVFALGSRYLTTVPCLAAWVLSIPMVLTDALLIGGAISPAHAWWIILGVGCGQLALLPFGVDKAQRGAVLRAWKEHGNTHFLRVKA